MMFRLVNRAPTEQVRRVWQFICCPATAVLVMISAMGCGGQALQTNGSYHLCFLCLEPLEVPDARSGAYRYTRSCDDVDDSCGATGRIQGLLDQRRWFALHSESVVDLLDEPRTEGPPQTRILAVARKQGAFVIQGYLTDAGHYEWSLVVDGRCTAGTEFPLRHGVVSWSAIGHGAEASLVALERGGSLIECTIADASAPRCFETTVEGTVRVLDARRSSDTFDAGCRLVNDGLDPNSRGYSYRSDGGFVQLSYGDMALWMDETEDGGPGLGLGTATTLDEVVYDRDGFPYLERRCVWPGGLEFRSDGCVERVWSFRELAPRQLRRLDRSGHREVRRDSGLVQRSDAR